MTHFDIKPLPTDEFDKLMHWANFTETRLRQMAGKKIHVHYFEEQYIEGFDIISACRCGEEEY